MPWAVLQSDTTALGFIQRQTSCVGLPLFLPKLVVTFLRISVRYPGKETSDALLLPSFAFLGIHNLRYCVFVCLFVLSFVMYLTTLSITRQLAGLVNNELEGMRKESSVAEYKTTPWNMPEGTEECHERSQPGWPYLPMTKKSHLPHTERCWSMADGLHSQCRGPGCSVRPGRLILLRPFAVFTSSLRGSCIKWFATRGAQIFKKIRNHLKILDPRRMIWNKSFAEEPQTPGVAQKSSLVVATAFLYTLPHSLATIIFPIDTVLWNRRPWATKASALCEETNECKLATKATDSPEMSIICTHFMMSLRRIC